MSGVLNLELAEKAAKAFLDIFNQSTNEMPSHTDSQTQGGHGVSPSDNDTEENAYKTLGLKPGASAEEVAKAHRNMAQMYHPDKVSHLAPEFRSLAEQRMKEINTAVEVLKSSRTTQAPMEARKSASEPNVNAQAQGHSVQIPESSSKSGDCLKPIQKFRIPPIEFLTPGEILQVNESALMNDATLITQKLVAFGIRGQILQIHPGPVFTTFDFKPNTEVKMSQLIGLRDDLCLAVKAISVIIERIPGKEAIAIRVQNPVREDISIREILDSPAFRLGPFKLPLAIGKQIGGAGFITDLSKMPHLLIAGSNGEETGNALDCTIMSILFKSTPEDVRFILIDPSRVRFSPYCDTPHLLTPVITDPMEASNALGWLIKEMESRRQKFALHGVREIDEYNSLVRTAKEQLTLKGERDPRYDQEKPLAHIVVLINELSDLMAALSGQIEDQLRRLTAVSNIGIHFVCATARPSADVITGTIKSEFRYRIAFKVAAMVDSRVILDANGAEELLGGGDMLFLSPGLLNPDRIHGASVSLKEIQAVIDYVRKQARPVYNDSVLLGDNETSDDVEKPISPGVQDALYTDAIRIVVTEGRASTSLLQRRFGISYGRAALLIDLMFHDGIVGPADGSKPRDILVGLDFLDHLK